MVDANGHQKGDVLIPLPTDLANAVTEFIARIDSCVVLRKRNTISDTCFGDIAGSLMEQTVANGWAAGLVMQPTRLPQQIPRMIAHFLPIVIAAGQKISGLAYLNKVDFNGLAELVALIVYDQVVEGLKDTPTPTEYVIKASEIADASQTSASGKPSTCPPDDRIPCCPNCGGDNGNRQCNGIKAAKDAWKGCPCIGNRLHPYKPFPNKQAYKDAQALLLNLPYLNTGVAPAAATATGSATAEPTSNFCNGMNTASYVGRDAAVNDIQAFCASDDFRNAKNADQRVSQTYGEDAQGKINSLDLLQIVIFYHSADAKRLTVQECEVGLKKTIDSCDTANNPANWKHGGQFSYNSRADLTTNPLMSRAKFADQADAKTTCDSSEKLKYSSTKSLKTSIASFCSQATKDLRKGTRSGDNYSANNQVYNGGQAEAVKFNVHWGGTGSQASEWYEDECNTYLGMISKPCAVFPDSDIFTYGGTVTVHGVDWSIQPQWKRQPAVKVPTVSLSFQVAPSDVELTHLEAKCGTWYMSRGYKWEVHGAGWETDDWGHGLLDWTNYDAATEWNFEYASPDILHHVHTDPLTVLLEMETPTPKAWNGWAMACTE